MQLACLALAPLTNEFLCETGSFSHHSTCCSSRSALSLSSASSQPRPHSPPPHHGFLLVWLFWLTFSFNSLVVGVPCNLYFWHFWLFIDFRLVVILLLVAGGSKWFLPMPPSWLELLKLQFSSLCNGDACSTA